MSRLVSLFILAFGFALNQAQPAAAQPTAAQTTAAQDAVAGLWLTQGRDGVIAIAPCGSDLCGSIVGFFLDRPSDPTPVDHRGVSQCNLPLISDARLVRPNLWKGHITDPRNGNVYGAELHVNPQGILILRGFFGIPLFGETQTWTRYTGSIPGNCRITPQFRAAVDHDQPILPRAR